MSIGILEEMVYSPAPRRLQPIRRNVDLEDNLMKRLAQSNY